MCNDQLVYNVVIWVFFGISLWTEKVALTTVFWVFFTVFYNSKYFFYKVKFNQKTSQIVTLLPHKYAFLDVILQNSASKIVL